MCSLLRLIHEGCTAGASAAGVSTIGLDPVTYTKKSNASSVFGADRQPAPIVDFYDVELRTLRPTIQWGPALLLGFAAMALMPLKSVSFP